MSAATAMDLLHCSDRRQRFARCAAPNHQHAQNARFVRPLEPPEAGEASERAQAFALATVRLAGLAMGSLWALEAQAPPSGAALKPAPNDPQPSIESWLSLHAGNDL